MSHMTQMCVRLQTVPVLELQMASKKNKKHTSLSMSAYLFIILLYFKYQLFHLLFMSS